MVENVYSIIDSKIQFMDYQIKEMIKAKLGKLPKGISEDVNFLPEHLANLSESDRMLAGLEAYSRNMSLLLLMRTSLTYLSAETAFFLLSNDKYLDFSEKQLRVIMEEALYDQATADLELVIDRAMFKLALSS
ncbi:MAG: hypothetical protein AAF573_12620 [Bacteroidota bacterium]